MHIPNYIFKDMLDSFKKWWQSAFDEDKRTFNQHFEHQYGPGSSPPPGSIIQLLKDCPKGSVVTLSQNGKPLRKVQILATEINYSAAQCLQICNEDTLLQETDVDNVHPNNNFIQDIDDDASLPSALATIMAMVVLDNSVLIFIDDDNVPLSNIFKTHIEE